MVSRNVAINSNLEVSGAKRRSDLVEIQIPRHFDIIDGFIICAHRLDRHFTVVLYLSTGDT